jgi:alpha-beta hydrolase superfamily lysophospholipase
MIAAMPARRVRVPQPPLIGDHEGLAYALFTPAQGPRVRGGVVILHGAGSCKESHFDFARAARAAGLAAIAFDQRGHGASAGELDARALDDVGTIADLLPAGPVALRGSSMGGYLALAAAPRLHARAVVAICPAAAEQLRRGLRRGDFEFPADAQALDELLAANDEFGAVASIDAALLLLHAEGDERVPVEHSRELFAAARTPDKRLIAVPGGHHRSVQHDSELQALSVRFILRALDGDARRGGRAARGDGTGRDGAGGDTASDLGGAT